MNNKKKFIYADNAATTKPHADVIAEMMPYITEEYGNPSSIYSLSDHPEAAIAVARERVADAIHATAREIYFTSGGSESDNWAIKGAAHALAKKGKKHIISSAFEHHAVLHTLEYLEKNGFEITYLPVHSNGIVQIDELKRAIRPDTALVTIMFANNEIGTIQPIAEIGAICREHKILFHTDAVQAIGHTLVDVNSMNIDLLSLSGHKLHGPKGIGALYIKSGVFIENFIHGGAQERGRRAGTENTAGIVGLGKAIELATSDISAKETYLRNLSNRFIDGASKIERSRLNGDRQKRLPGNVNMCFEGVEGESLLLMLDGKGISASSGSACTSGSLDPSHVLLSIGLIHEIAHGSLRLSFSMENTTEEIDYILEVLPPIIERLRAMSPLWERIKNDEKSACKVCPKAKHNSL